MAEVVLEKLRTNNSSSSRREEQPTNLILMKYHLMDGIMGPEISS